MPIYHLSGLNPINQVHSPQNNENSVQFCGDFFAVKRKKTKTVRRQMKIDQGYLSSPLQNWSAFHNFAKTATVFKLIAFSVLFLFRLSESLVKPCWERGEEEG